MTIHVDENATGANDGTSWTDAYTSMLSADGAGGAAAGERVKCAYTHDELISGAQALDWTNGTVSNPVLIISTDPADDSRRDGARFGSSDNNLQVDGHWRSYGMNWQAGISGDTDFGGNDDWYEMHGGKLSAGDDCLFAARNKVVFHDVTISPGDLFTGSFSGKIEVYGGSVINGSTFGFVHGSGFGTHYIFRGVDLTGVTATDLVHGSFAGFGGESVIFDRCSLKASWQVRASTVPLNEVFVYNCDDGTPTDPALQFLYSTYGGTVTLDTARYRDDGATYRTVNFSYTIASDANTRELVCPLVAEIPIHLDLEPDTSPSGATFKAIKQSSLMAVDGTPAGLTSDSKTWTGSDVGTKYRFEFASNNEDGGTITCYIAGPAGLNDDDVEAELFEPDQVGGEATLKIKLYKPSTQISVCPAAEVS